MSISRRLKLPAIIVSAVLLSAVLAEGAFRLAGVRATNLTEGVYQTFRDGSFRLQENADAYLALVPEGLPRLHERGLRPRGQGRSGLGPRSRRRRHRGRFAGARVGPRLREVLSRDLRRAVQGGGGVGCQHLRGRARPRQPAGGSRLAPRGARHAREAGHPLHGPVAGFHLRPVRPTPCAGGGLYSAPPSAIIKAKVWLASRFASYSVVRNAWKNLRGKEEVRFLDIFEKSRAEERRTRLRGALKEFRDECTRSGASLVVVYLPDSYIEQVDAVDPDRLDGQLPGRLCRETAEELGVPFIDFSPVLRNLIDQGLPVALKGDPHYSLEMNAACAKVLWDGLDWAGLNRRKQ